MNKNWLKKKSVDREKSAELAESLGVSPILSDLLVARGISTFDEAKTFFRPDLNDLHDPFLMKDMDKAVGRLSSALEAGEKILVYGDYDVDGTTAVTVVFGFLKKQGASCDYYIPDRYTEGYGFSFKSVEWAAENGFDLIITLDCGIKDGAKVARANELGIDVIVCDHHNPSELPPAFAVLDPKRPDCSYPDKGLSGCGVGFKFMQAICIARQLPFDELFQYLDLLTISIGADIVPLVGENRILAYHGLAQMAAGQRPGVQAMLEQAQRKKTDLTITDVVFIIAPRINAAGRIFSGKQAVQLLLSDSIEEAMVISASVEENNNTRRALDKGITVEALQQVENDAFYQTSFSTVVHNEGWHKGVIGIVASRLVDTYYKPTIVLTSTNGKLAGSARSIAGIDMYEALGQCTDLLEQYGGHTMAAGLSMELENFEAFRIKFDGVIAEMLNHQHSMPYIEYDHEVTLEDMNAKFYRILNQFAPFGPDNMRPVFRANGLVNARFSKPVGETGSHMKLHLCHPDNPHKTFDGIGFDLGHWGEGILQGKPIDVLFSLEENDFQGRVTLQMNVKDIRYSEEQ